MTNMREREREREREYCILFGGLKGKGHRLL